METPIKFKDFNFKLAVITEIIGNQYSNKFCLDPFKFAKKYKRRKIDIEEEGYEIIPEIKEYYEKLEVFPSEVKDIQDICQDGGDDIYLTLCPFWSGEDEIFNITSVEDAKYLPKLKSITLFYHDDNKILEDFKQLNISAEWV